MANKEIIHVTFDGKGGSTITLENVYGAKCTELTADLEAALGTVVSDEETPEIHSRGLENNEYRLHA